MFNEYNGELTEQDIANLDIFEEIGKVGQRKYDGVFFEEFEPKLKGRKAIEVYKEMSVNDEIIGAILFAIEMLVKQAEFYIEAASNDPKDQEAKEFIEECFEDLNPGWDATLTEILSFLTYGWSIHEICYKRRNGLSEDKCESSKYTDGLIGWAKFATRAQDTLYKWVYNEHDDLIAFVQMTPPDSQIRSIPIKKCLHFRTRSQKENPEGQSILRSSYRSYYFKSRFQVIEGIGVERDLAGLPILKPDPNSDIFNEDDLEMVAKRQWAQAVITNLRRDELEGVLLPNGWEIELLASSGSRQFDVGAIIERYDKKIAQTVLADFITLGHDGTGSYALSQNKTNTFFLAISSYLDIIVEVINNQAIPALINLNGDHFSGITDYPTMSHSKIEKRDLAELSSYITSLVGCGVLSPDNELEKYLRQEADLPDFIEGDEFDRDIAGNVDPDNEETDDTTQEEENQQSKNDQSTDFN